MSGIDMALWDIKGKALGMPVWKLLGGGFHKQIRCYASSLFGSTPAATRDKAQRFRDMGFNAVKFGWAPMGGDERTDIALVSEARRGLGDEADLMIDAGLVWDAKTAIKRARAFGEYNIFWLEEPLKPDDYEGYRRLSEAAEVRIAAGEEESSRLSYLDLMDRGKIDIVQVDLARCGGFTEGMKIASLAWDRGLSVANHGFTTYVNVAAALHWLNAVPNALICEFVAQEGTGLREVLTRQSFVAKEGMLSIPDEPGLGVELNEDAITKYRVS
jgi:L-alanine-DL-glutamate epimerase-like enolase superfamily enzyme